MKKQNRPLSNNDLCQNLHLPNSELNSQYSSEEQTAINCLNSRYTYEHVSLFRQNIYDIFMNSDPVQMKMDQIKTVTDFVKVMLKLIDCPYQTFTIKNILENPIEIKAKAVDHRHQKTVQNIHSKVSIKKHMRWIADILKQQEVSTILLLDSYYSRFSF